MSKQVAKVDNQKTELAAYTGGMNDFGFDTATTNDIKVPLIFVAQGLSKIVDQGLAQNGDIVENLENQVIAKKGGTAKFVPFFFQKSYQVQYLKNGKKEFFGNEAWDGEREYETKGKDRNGVETTFFNVPSFNFFVFRENDPNHTRYVLPFRGSRNISKGGKVVLSQLISKMQGATPQPPYNFVIEVGVEQVENEKGKWYIMNAKLSKDSTTDNNTRAAAAQAAADIKAMFAAGMTIDTSEAGGDEPEATTKKNNW